MNAALGYGDFLKKSYDFGVGGGALGALLAGALYLKIGTWPGFFAAFALTAGCLALNGYLGKWLRAARARLEDGRIARQEEERRRREEEADQNFEIDRRTMLRPEEMIRETPRRARPHAPETPVEGARRRAAAEPASPMDAPRRTRAAAPVEDAPRRRARTDEPVSPMEARSRRPSAEAEAPAEEAPRAAGEEAREDRAAHLQRDRGRGPGPRGRGRLRPRGARGRRCAGGARPEGGKRRRQRAAPKAGEEDLWEHPSKAEPPSRPRLPKI